MKWTLLPLLLLGACSAKPPVISAGAECVAFHRIETTPDQDKAASANPSIWYALYLQLTTHNIEYQKRCAK